MRENFIHPSSFVDEEVSIGKDTKIWHFCHIMPNVKIGENCNIGQNVFIASGVTIGNNVKIQNNVSVYTGVIIENDVFLGPSMVFTNVINPRSQVDRHGEYQNTIVKKGATIGANATIVCGITLGDYAFIGAGAVVTKDVQKFGLIYGNPGQLQGWMCQCGERLYFSDTKQANETVCDSCGRKYLQESAVKIKGLK